MILFNKCQRPYHTFPFSDLCQYELKFDNNLHISAAVEYVFSGLDSATEYTIEVRVVTKDYSHSDCCQVLFIHESVCTLHAIQFEYHLNVTK